MPAGMGRDTARQAANVAGALLLVVLALVTAGSVSDIANQHRTLILPAGYAFTIWTPIFALAVVYAAYQALPDRREDPLLRRIGWLTAGGLLASALWQPVFAARWYVPAQLLIAVAFALLALALLGFVDDARRREPSGMERWLVAPLLGLFGGWITAATLVGLAATLAALGVAGDGFGAALGGAALLLLGSAVATVVLLAGKRGPAALWVGYGAAVIWALLAVAANQANDSLLTTVAALLAAVPLGLIMVGRLPSAWRRRGAAEPAG